MNQLNRQAPPPTEWLTLATVATRIVPIALQIARAFAP